MNTLRRHSLHWSDGTIAIDGPIKPDMVSATALRRSLDELRDEPELRVLIQSPGGDCTEGLAAYTALREAGKPIIATVRYAGSMAAILAMAASRIEIAPDGAFYLHSSGFAADAIGAMTSGSGMWGSASVLRNVAKSLERSDATHLDIICRRTRLDRARVQELRERDTTICADEAIRLGLADRIAPC